LSQLPGMAFAVSGQFLSSVLFQSLRQLPRIRGRVFESPIIYPRHSDFAPGRSFERIYGQHLDAPPQFLSKIRVKTPVERDGYAELRVAIQPIVLRFNW